MNFYKDSIDKLNYFIDNDILLYAKNRNYDYGPGQRNNVSMLSKYITHRVISEYDIVNLALSKYSLSKIEKFIQEVFWRIYWKGWLEHRPSVWDDYYNSNFLSVEVDGLKEAENSNTKIECFNHWMNELKETNYLHNHTRMWFASIWIFTLKLPWELGANLFMKHLYDGDAASNTLSWRWVAGLQTIGKHYLATSSNIYKFTNNKFKPMNLNEKADPVNSEKTYNPKELDLINVNKSNDSLLIFENNLDYKNNKLLYGNYKKIYVLLLENKARKIKLCNNVLAFKESLVNEFSNNINHAHVISSDYLIETLRKKQGIDIVYPGIGENLSFLESIKSETDLNYLYNEDDIFCWKFSKKGFFNFKKNIPSIIAKVFGSKELF